MHSASQPPASDQIVMHQSFVDGAQQQVQHHEAANDGTLAAPVGIPNMHGGIEEHHVNHAAIAPSQQSGLYGNGEQDYRNIEAGESSALAPELKEQSEEAKPEVPHDDGVHVGTKRGHTTHAGHVEPAMNADQIQPVSFFGSHSDP